MDGLELAREIEGNPIDADTLTIPLFPDQLNALTFLKNHGRIQLAATIL
jgi:hypothetical protein